MSLEYNDNRSALCDFCFYNCEYCLWGCAFWNTHCSYFYFEDTRTTKQSSLEEFL